jgi:hypothetical protein
MLPEMTDAERENTVTCLVPCKCMELLKHCSLGDFKIRVTSKYIPS